MKTFTLTFPELALLVGTRAILGAGIALLIAKRLTDSQRHTAGCVLVGVGLISTVPLAFELFGKASGEKPTSEAQATEQNHGTPEGASLTVKLLGDVWIVENGDGKSVGSAKDRENAISLARQAATEEKTSSIAVMTADGVVERVITV